MFKKISIGLVTLTALAVAIYIRFLRPWQLHWGATEEEVERAMPGDDVVKHPTFHATRGVTVQARPEEIWPWLVQIGVTRAGWYSYDLFDNLGKASAERIIPELQHVAVGDVIPKKRATTHGSYKSISPDRECRSLGSLLRLSGVRDYHDCRWCSCY